MVRAATRNKDGGHNLEVCAIRSGPTTVSIGPLSNEDVQDMTATSLQSRSIEICDGRRVVGRDHKGIDRP